jgi:hypothetical protein
VAGASGDRHCAALSLGDDQCRFAVLERLTGKTVTLLPGPGGATRRLITLTCRT